MAHAIVEYSANLEEKIDLKGLVDEVHDACIKTGVFPLSGLRTSAGRRATSSRHRTTLLLPSPLPARRCLPGKARRKTSTGGARIRPATGPAPRVRTSSSTTAVT